MKKMQSLLFGLAVLLFASNAFAVGSWAVLTNDEGYLDGALGAGIGLVREATSDASAATVPTWPDATDSEMANFAGFIVGYEVDFDASVPPTSVVINLQTKYGQTINTDTSATVNTGSVRVIFDTPQFVAGGLYGTITVVGNSKKFKVIIYALR